MDIDGKHEWRDCIEVPGVRLPRGYYFGTSSITGDLSGTATCTSYLPQLKSHLGSQALVRLLRGESQTELWEADTLGVFIFLHSHTQIP